MIDKRKLLEQLDRATDKAAALVVGRKVRLRRQTHINIGALRIKENTSGLYDIISGESMLYADISTIDIAIIVAQRYITGEQSSIRQVLNLAEKYSKYRVDMIHYLHCLKSAQKSRDIERMAILEDKFQMAEYSAKVIRGKISSFKRLRTGTDFDKYKM